MKNVLYARSLNGNIKMWSADDTSGGYIIISSGYLGMKQAIRYSKVTHKGELESITKSKRRAGYKSINELMIIDNISDDMFTNENILELVLNKYLPKSNVDLDFNLKPMKCQPFKPNKFKYDAIAQPKLNGIRGVMRLEEVTTGDGMFARTEQKPVIRSKSGIRYHVPHITDNISIDAFHSIFGELVYDGELYIHGYTLNKIKSAVPMINEEGLIYKSSNPELIPLVKFNVFDLAIEDMSQLDRLNLIKQHKEFLYTLETEPIIIVPSITISTDMEATDLATKYVMMGYEGAVIRNIDAEYQFGSRPMTMMKIKKVQDAEFQIIDIIGKDKESDSALFILKNDINNNIFKCNPMGDASTRRDYLSNKHLYIGKYATVKFFERSGVEKVPFHANLVTIRDYE